MTTKAVSLNAATSGLPPAHARAQIHRGRSRGMSMVAFEQPRLRELELTLVSENAEPVDALAERLAQFLKHNEAAAVQQFVFGSVTAHAETMRALRYALGNVDWPVTWTEGASCAGSPIAGMQIRAVTGAPVQTLTHNGRVIGRVFDDGEARHCLLGDIGPANTSSSAPDQARETFDNLEAALGLGGMAMNDVARTWFFLDDILSWYGQFNAVRNAFFARGELRPSSFPASTGVGGKNPRGTALVAGAWAVKSHNAAAAVRVVPSPKQCPAPAYGSAFSRAIEIISPNHRRLLVSGTASIGPDGHTAHVGDARGQIELTMDVVRAILHSRGMTLADAARATVYFKSVADHPLFAAWCAANGLEDLPVVSACGDICRDDLLFEIELDAASCVG